MGKLTAKGITQISEPGRYGDGQPSQGWALFVSAQPPDERQASLEGMPAPQQLYH